VVDLPDDVTWTTLLGNCKPWQLHTFVYNSQTRLFRRLRGHLGAVELPDDVDLEYFDRHVLLLLFIF